MKLKEGGKEDKVLRAILHMIDHKPSRSPLRGEDQNHERTSPFNFVCYALVRTSSGSLLHV